MVHIPMICHCDVRVLKLALTACLSSPLLSSSLKKATSECPSVCGWGRSWHTVWRLQTFMVRRETRACTHVYQKVHQVQINISGCCMFLLNTFPARNCLNQFVILQPNQLETGKHTADCQVCALILLWSQTPQSHYKISLINTGARSQTWHWGFFTRSQSPFWQWALFFFFRSLNLKENLRNIFQCFENIHSTC